MKNKLTYTGPLPLYISYYILLALSVSLIVLSFRLNLESFLFLQIMATGVATTLISLTLILYSTKLIRKIDSRKWLQNAREYYEDEGEFDYTHNGFCIDTWNSGKLEVRWNDIIKVEAKEQKVNNVMKIISIDLYFSEKDFITIDSTIKGFKLFERRIREHLDEIWKREPISTERAKVLKFKKQKANL